MIPFREVIKIKHQDNENDANVIKCTNCGKVRPSLVFWMGDKPFCSFECHQKWKSAQKE